jgi:cullin-associated NEDD8-dissociated protein 1
MIKIPSVKLVLFIFLRSELNIEFEPSLILEVLILLSSFLRKNNRTLKLTSIATILALYKKYSTNMDVNDIKTMFANELPFLLSENDLHVSQISLNLITFICKSKKVLLVNDLILNQIISLIQSPLLQGVALESCIEFFVTVTKQSFPGLKYRDIVNVSCKTSFF